MANGGGNTLTTTIVEGYNTTVAQWQLNFALTLLTCNFTRHATVNLIGQPVFTSHSLQLEHALQVFVYLVLSIGYVFIFALYGIVAHDGFG